MSVRSINVARKEQLIVAISGMLGTDISLLAASQTEQKIRENLCGAARDRALAYFNELAGLNKPHKKARHDIVEI